MKVAIVSHLLPPSFNGQSMMLYRLLKDVAPARYCLISGQSLEELEQLGRFSERLPAKYFHLWTKFEVSKGYRYGLSVLRELFNVTVGTLVRARQIARIARDEQCDAVLSCSSGVDLLDVPSGFVASWLTGLKYYVYLFDTYSHMWIQPETRFIGRRLEPLILKRATGIVVTNESVRDLLQQRYGITATVIHNPCDLSEYEELTKQERKPEPGDVRVVYTGAIYAAQADTMRNLVAAIQLLRRPEVKLHLYTTTETEWLAAQGISGPVERHGHLPVSEMPAVQHRADVLFLPLAFDSPYPELIRISSPSKIGEYLAAGRPVLVHAPSDSYIATYFREHDCGLVVDENDPAKLAAALERLLTDRNLAERLRRNALAQARDEFSLVAAQSTFFKLMEFELQPESRREENEI